MAYIVAIDVNRCELLSMDNAHDGQKINLFSSVYVHKTNNKY